MWRIIDRGGESSAVELWISVPIVLMADNRELTVYRTNYMNPVLHRNCLLTKLPKYSHSELIFILWIFAVSFFQVLLNTSAQGTVYVYGAVAVTSSIISFLLPIETKGREMPVSVAA